MNGIRPEFHFTPADFAAMEDHRALWRFDDDVLPQVRLLVPATGRIVHAILAPYVRKRADVVTAIEVCDASRDETVVAAWLLGHDPDAAQEVVVSPVSHGGRAVYVVAWGLFCVHWSSFCLPASDDVVIAPLSEAWVLLYDHEEVFTWGRPRCTGG